MAALAVALIAVVGVGVGACGGPDEPLPPSELRGTDGPVTAADFLLTEGKETAGFVAQPASSRGAGGPPLDELADCLGMSADALDDEAHDEAIGDDFVSESNDAVMAGSEAEIVPESQVTTDRGALRHPRFAECYGEEFGRILADATSGLGVTYELVASEAVEPPSGATGATRISLDVTYTGAATRVVFDVVFIMDGRVEVRLFFSNLDEPMPADIVAPMVDQVAAKISDH
jgi:hypothetical protein